MTPIKFPLVCAILAPLLLCACPLGRGGGAAPAVAPKALAQAERFVRSSGPELLSYQELLTLSQPDPLADALAAKVKRLATTPFVNNQASVAKTRPVRPGLEGLGPGMRLTLWNIERGMRFEEIVAVFTQPDKFYQRARKGVPADRQATLLEEMKALRTADVLVLNEVDWGLKRSGYRNVVAELAAALEMNWAYGVEFLEVDPMILGSEKFLDIEDEQVRADLVKETQVEPARIKGMHGTAVLSRYPIVNADLVPFATQGYDWFESERSRVSPVESGKRKVAATIFQETISREIRRGGRTSLIVTLSVPELPDGRLTVAATHLENRVEPSVRGRQMNELLQSLRGVDHPVIIAGDLNTTGSDQQPTSLKREVYRRIGSKSFWAERGIKYATGVGLIYDVVKGGVGFLKNQGDPTAQHIPLVAPNPESEMFSALENFRFEDGTVFDFRGSSNRTVNQTAGTLANSNQRDSKGFVSTYQVERSVSVMGKLKLDWILVKSYLENSRNEKGPYRFAPHFARTMETLNYALEEPLSDHSPMSIDLPFEEPEETTAAPTARNRRPTAGTARDTTRSIQ